MTTNEPLGERAKTRRLELGLSAVELAERVGVTFQTIYRYESGELRPSYPEGMASLAAALEIEPCRLYFPGQCDGEAA